MDLRELLSVPYLLEAEAVETEPGKWLVRLAYPELPGCTAEGFVVEDALRELERRRIEMIVSLVEAGKQPPIPRKPLARIRPALDRSRSRIVEPASPLCLEARRNSPADAAAGFDGGKLMLSREDNERLVRVGRGTPLGDLFRLYWIPVFAFGRPCRRRAAEAHPAAGRGSGGLQGYRRPGRSGRPGVSRIAARR